MGRIDAGTYRVKVKVFDNLWRHEVVSTITINIKNIPEEAVLNSGSIRLSGELIVQLCIGFNNPHVVLTGL